MLHSRSNRKLYKRGNILREPYVIRREQYLQSYMNIFNIGLTINWWQSFIRRGEAKLEHLR